MAPLVPASAARAATHAYSANDKIPVGYEHVVDPRTATRVPLTMSLRDGVLLYPGDSAFTYEVATDTRTPAHDDGGYLLERITSLGKHRASHISAPVHFIVGGKPLSQLEEDFTLMPLAVVDVRPRVAADGPDFQVTTADCAGGNDDFSESSAEGACCC